VDADGDGMVPPMSVMTTPQEWRGYLREYGELYLRTANEFQRIQSEQVATHWTGYEPATEQAVFAAEQRLGVLFPPSLRGLLLTSDGWSGVGGWIDSLHSCDHIAWSCDTAEGAALIALCGHEQDDVTGDDLGKVLQRSLMIASGEDYWFLDPGQLGPGGEWAAYLLEPEYGEATRFTSFAELFHASREEMEEELVEVAAVA
jgi:hypothetical protein